MTSLRIATLWIRGDDGSAMLDPRLSRTDDPELTRNVLAYLHSGLGFLRASGLTADRLDPAKGEVVPIHYSTDGEWIWSGAHSYYLEHHGVLPEPDFLAHMAAQGYQAPPVSREVGLEAERLLRS